jgi:hypothetical protein
MKDWLKKKYYILTFKKLTHRWKYFSSPPHSHSLITGMLYLCSPSPALLAHTAPLWEVRKKYFRQCILCLTLLVNWRGMVMGDCTKEPQFWGTHLVYTSHCISGKIKHYQLNSESWNHYQLASWLQLMWK